MAQNFEGNWANTSDTVRKQYNERVVDEKFGGQVTTSGRTKQVSWKFSYDDLPVNGPGKMEAFVPKGAFITNAWINVLTAMTGTVGTLTIGLEEADGTVIDVDGIDVAVAQAALVLNTWIICDGALVNTAGNLITGDGQLLVSTGGTVTAGKFEVIIEYIDPSIAL